MTSVPLEDDSTFRGNRVIIFTAIWIPVQIICIVLRYVARWMINGPWVKDDILIFTALFLQICQAGVDISKYHQSKMRSINLLLQVRSKMVALAIILPISQSIIPIKLLSGSSIS
jgi:hypothetical protein